MAAGGERRRGQSGIVVRAWGRPERGKRTSGERPYHQGKLLELLGVDEVQLGGGTASSRARRQWRRRLGC
jgi:hypothetical protein